MDNPQRRDAAAPRSRRGCSAETSRFRGRDVAVPRRRVAAAATWIIRGSPSLVPYSSPSRRYRLEYKTWRDADAVRVYDYARGEAIVVDGRAPHRTAPFSAADLGKCRGERVLVCLNYASTDPAARAAQESVMRSQTPRFYKLPP